MTYVTKPQADRCDFHPRVACVERYHSALFSEPAPSCRNTAANPNNQQFYDLARIPWANPANNFFNAPTLYGLANLLNGANGNISFEAALVGSCNTPANPLTGVWQVCVLEDFTWGMNFTYHAGSGGSAGNYTNANYTEAIQAINFSNMVSNSFEGAFDQLGNNAPVEWDVQFTQANYCIPAPGGLFIILTAGGLLFGGKLLKSLKRSLSLEAGRDPAQMGLEVWVSPGVGNEDDWRGEVSFWKAAGVTHVTAHTTYISDHHRRIAGSSAADHLAAITRYRAAVADLL